MKKIILFFLFSYFTTALICQSTDYTAYRKKVKEAYNFYESQEFKKSAHTYAEAFDLLDRKAFPNDRYNAACAYSLSGEKDSALYHLYRLADGKSAYKNLNHLIKDSDLESLHPEKEWLIIVKKVAENKIEAEKYLESELVKKLDTIYSLDQTLRKQIDSINKEFGRNSAEIKKHWKKIQKQDSINEKYITNLIDKRGWLGSEIVGDKGNNTLFLVIQHAPKETQEKYLPLMREAVKNGKASGGNLALLEDRINLKNGKKQIYGSQIGYLSETDEYYVRALADPENVDQRRESVNLGSLNDYTSFWNFSFDATEYLKNIKKYEALLEKNFEKK